MPEKKLLHAELTQEIIGAYYRVYNTLGYGFVEKVYHHAMIIELLSRGLSLKSEQPITVYYQQIPIGTYYADLVVENKIILELKAAQYVSDAHLAQLTNYLSATDMELGLLLNFGKQAKFVRRVLLNSRKKAFGG